MKWNAFVDSDRKHCELFIHALIMVFVSLSVVPQDVQDQALPRQEAETEQADPPVDQNEDWQQDQVSAQHCCFCTAYH